MLPNQSQRRICDTERTLGGSSDFNRRQGLGHLAMYKISQLEEIIVLFFSRVEFHHEFSAARSLPYLGNSLLCKMIGLCMYYSSYFQPVKSEPETLRNKTQGRAARFKEKIRKLKISLLALL